MSRFGWFLAVFLVLAMLERLFELRYSQRAQRGARKKTWIMTALHLVYGSIYVATAIDYFVYRQEAQLIVTAVGLALYGVALWLRLTAIRALGQFWSLHLEIREKHQLVKEGIYRFMRHPAYTAIMLEVIAIPLVGNAYSALLIAVGVYIPCLLLRWYHEEAEMVAKFGETYEQYRRKVPAFVPRVR